MKFWLEGEITEESATKLIKEISVCPASRIELYINSSGGCYNSSKYLHSYISALDKEVVTIVVGECMSGAVLVCVAGDERWATTLAKFMIHEAYDEGLDDDIGELVTGADVSLGAKQYQQLAAVALKKVEECNKETAEYYRLISQNSNLTLPKIKKHVEVAKNGDWEFSAKEALRFHIVDNIGLPGEDSEEKVSNGG